jgi:hypothetical protein
VKIIIEKPLTSEKNNLSGQRYRKSHLCIPDSAICRLLRGIPVSYPLVSGAAPASFLGYSAFNP